MISSKLKKMKKEELRKELANAIAERDDTMFNVQSGREKDYGQIKEQKKKVARILTLINMKKDKGKNHKEGSRKPNKKIAKGNKKKEINKLKEKKDEKKNNKKARK